MTRTGYDLPHYVYRCYSGDGRAVYVGCTRNLPARLNAHAASSFWAPLVVKVKATVHPGKWAGLSAEREAIRAERPRFNIVGRYFAAEESSWTDAEWNDYLLALEHGVGSPEYRAHRTAKARSQREAWQRVQRLLEERSA